jgi:5-formyltetrahydrofolate cyclo-ligase
MASVQSTEPPDPTTVAEKARLRGEFLERRRRMSAGALESARAALRGIVIAHVVEAGWTCVACYVPLRTEPASFELLDGLIDAGVLVLVPVLLPDRDLDWARWDPSPGVTAEPMGLSVVRDAGAVIVPALAVARDGIRLGRGGGSYDRALARVSPTVPVAALLFDGEVVDELPRDPWDRPVTAAVTPGAGWTPLG